MLFVDQVRDESAKFGRVLDFVLGFAEYNAEHSRPLAKFLQCMAVMRFEFVAILGQQRRPVLTLGNGRRLVVRRLRLLVCHFQKQQKRQLLDVIAVRQAIIPQDVAVVPELLDERCRVVGHRSSFVGSANQMAGQRSTIPSARAFVWPQRVISFVAFELFSTTGAFDDVNLPSAADG